MSITKRKWEEIHSGVRRYYENTFDEINAITGFAMGDRFKNDAEVRAYFQREELIACKGGDPEDIPDQASLDEMAAYVIERRWHYARPRS